MSPPIDYFRPVGSDAAGWRFEKIEPPPAVSLWRACCWLSLGSKDRHGREKKRATSWEHPALPDVWVKHCGHPTALRPYHVAARRPDFPQLGTFRSLADAQAAALGTLAAPPALPSVPPRRQPPAPPSQGSLFP